MAEHPRLTVAVPTCNGSRYLAVALRSILAQQGVDFDLIVSDDRSEDDTLEIVRDLAGDRARVSVNDARLGLAGNWNRCVALSRTEWVAIFHQDDVMMQGHLAAHAGQIARFMSPGASECVELEWGMICGAAEVIDAEGRPVPPTVVERSALDRLPCDISFPPGEFVRDLAVSNPVRCSAVTIRKSAHDALGGFDPAYRYAVDWDFWIRLAQAYTVRWLARPTVAFRWHQASETHTFTRGTLDLDEQVRLLDTLFEKHRAALDAPHRLRGAANRRLARAYLNRAYEASKAHDPTLARRCLGRSIGFWPGILGTIALDPKLAARLAAAAITPARGEG